MSTTVRSLADVDLRGSLIFGKNLTSFPPNPRQGEQVLKDGVLWIYTTILGIATWYPLTNKKNSYLHTQAVESFQWTVHHGLGTPDVIIGVYDAAGSLMYASSTPIDNNSFRLNFTSATAGRCVVFADSERYASNLSTTSLLASSIDVSSGTVVADAGGLKVNGNTVATLDNTGALSSTQVPNVPWVKVTGAPTTLAGYGIADAFTKTEATTLVGTMDTKVAAAKAEIMGGVGAAYTTFAEVEDAMIAESAARSAADLTLQASIDTLSADITAQLGAASGIATLGSDGKVPTAQLPSYVDDVLEFATQANFPVTGEASKIYVAKDTNKTYRWSGSTYVYITSGAVGSVAGKTGVVTLVKADVGLANVDNTADSVKNVLTATKLVTARTLSVSGDASGSTTFDGSANAGISVTLANSGVTAGTYPKVTVDTKGRVTGGTTLLASDIPDISATYQPKNANLSSVANISTASTGLVKMTNGVASLDSTAYITGNQSITVSGDASGSGTTAISLTLANSGVTAGTYKSVTVDAKGRVTGGTNPTTLSGYGITDAAPLASPALTGTPTAPTAAANTNTTQLATTAFVIAQIAAAGRAGTAIDGGSF
jgi:hypothetical protein